MSTFIKGYLCGLLTIPFLLGTVYLVFVLTWGRMFRKSPPDAGGTKERA